MGNWTINEEQVQKIIDTKPIEISESNVPNDLTLSKKERIENARNVLNRWKNK